MKMKLLAATALISTSIFNPAYATAVGSPTANPADATTQAAEQAQCDALAGVHGPATGDNDHWSATVVEGGVTLVSGPTENGPRTIGTITPTGTYVPSVLEIRGNPFKNGGSVNLFGDQWATAGYYPDSTYDYTANFDSTFAHAFSCNIYDAVYHAAYTVHHDAVPAQGYYTNAQDNGNGDCHGIPNTNPNWGADIGHCIWTQTAPGQDAYDEDFPATWDNPALVGNEAGTAVNQDQSDNLSGFEPHGGRVNVTGDYHVGQPVVCISPGSKGGSWKAQNGYSGGSFTGPAAGCNTPYFKIAPTYNGSTTSNGTFTSVPNYSL